MSKEVRFIVVTKDGVKTEHKDNVTALCKVLKVPYGTIIKKKMPFEYRGIKFERVVIK